MLRSLPPIALRRLSGAALAGGLIAAAAPAAGQLADVTYPPSRALTDVAAWLQHDTPITLAQVVDVSPSAVTAITAQAPTAKPRGFLANISSEAVDPQILSQEGIASWNIPVEIDCEKRTVRLGAMTGYRSRDLRSGPRVVREADTAWVSPTPIAPLGATIRALCDHDYHRPFSGKMKVAAKPPQPSVAAPVASPAPAASPIPAPTSAPTPIAEAPKPPALRPTLPPAQPVASTPPATPVKQGAKKLTPPKGGGSISVQIGASPSRPDIDGLLAKFKKAHGSELGGLNPNVATVQMSGKTVNRALISGFATNAEANAFCKQLAAEGQACFIRR